jgi:hypothetical protein
VIHKNIYLIYYKWQHGKKWVLSEVYKPTTNKKTAIELVNKLTNIRYTYKYVPYKIDFGGSI